MSYSMPYRAGEWLVTCDICAKVRYSSEVAKTEDGYLACKEHASEIRIDKPVLAKQDNINIPADRTRPWTYDRTDSAPTIDGETTYSAWWNLPE